MIVRSIAYKQPQSLLSITVHKESYNMVTNTQKAIAARTMTFYSAAIAAYFPLISSIRSEGASST